MKCQQCQKRDARRRFCSNRCKDRWHNTHNPRGHSVLASIRDKADEDSFDNAQQEWDEHKGYFN